MRRPLTALPLVVVLVALTLPARGPAVFAQGPARTVRVGGLDQPVEILRDRWGINHIYAEPGRWTPSVVISRHQALTSNLTSEVAYVRAMRAIGAERRQELIHFHGGDPVFTRDPAIDIETFPDNVLELYEAFRKPIDFRPGGRRAPVPGDRGGRTACAFNRMPSENMVWADRIGTIGWQAAGIQPLRRNWSGLLPVRGDGRYEWDGYLPIPALPSRVNPPDGFIVSPPTTISTRPTTPTRRPATTPLVARSVDEAVAELTHRFGPDMALWQYGQPGFHHALIRHPLSNAVNREMRAKLGVGPAPRGGDGLTVSATGSGDSQTSGGSLKIIADTENWDRSVGLNTPGQSGDPDDPHYRDLFDLWAKGHYFTLAYTRPAIEAVTESVTRIEPVAPIRH